MFEGINAALIRERDVGHYVPEKISLIFEVPKKTMVIDLWKSSQILINFVSNAIKYAGKYGSIRVQVCVCPREELPTPDVSNFPSNLPLEFLLVEVIDKGPGPAKEVALFTDAFLNRRKGKSVSGRHSLGLGLPLSCKNACRMRGAIGHEMSSRGESVFFFCVPLQKIDLPKPATGYDLRDSVPKRMKRLRILAVDDECMNLSILSKMLARKGFDHVERASNFEDVVEKARNVDIILLDFQLDDGATGIDVLNALKRKRRMPTIGVIIVTAHAVEDIRKRCERAGCHGFVTKPFSAKAIVSEIKKVCEGQIY